MKLHLNNGQGRIPPGMYAEVRQHIKSLLDGGIIQKSKSPWASNVVVPEENGELRMCVDFRQLNLRTKKDSYALPRTEEILEALAGNRFFTILDMKSGYHQIELHDLTKNAPHLQSDHLGSINITGCVRFGKRAGNVSKTHGTVF